MNRKTTSVLYWVATGLFSAFMLMSGVMNALQTKESVQVMQQLGYPAHVLLVLGIGKTLGALALLQPWFRTAKEWAYAGFTFDLIGASAAWLAIGSGVAAGLFPLLFLLPMIASYVLWKKRLRQQAAPTAEASGTPQLALAGA